MIILASSSITRAKMLTRHGVAFIQKSAPFDEEALTSTNPKTFVYQATIGKMNAYIDAHGLGDIPILCADTVVSANDTILRKAKNKDDAKRILQTQSGNTVSIITCTYYKSQEKTFLDISSTEYLFETFNEDDLTLYLQSNLWEGKAGACMVEGFCKKYIKEVQGYESCAMGLSIDKLLPYLSAKKV